MGPRALKRLPSTGLIISCLGIGASSCDGDTGAAPSATAGSESSAVPSTLSNETTSELASSDPTSDSPTTLAAPRSFDGDNPDAAATSPAAAETGHDETTTAASPATENDQRSSSTAPDAGRESDASAPVPANWPSATPDVCTFAINGGPSPQISMVGVVGLVDGFGRRHRRPHRVLFERPQSGRIQRGRRRGNLSDEWSRLHARAQVQPQLHVSPRGRSG